MKVPLIVRFVCLLLALAHAATVAASAALTVTTLAPGCMANHSLFLTSDGSLWGMGWSDYGQLGSSTFGGTNRPVASSCFHAGSLARPGERGVLSRTAGR